MNTHFPVVTLVHKIFAFTNYRLRSKLVTMTVKAGVKQLCPSWIKTLAGLVNRRFDDNARFRVVWLSGARGTGKTTVLRALRGQYFDCEDPVHWQIQTNPERFLSEVERHQHFIILDEAGALPDPTRILRELLRKPSLGVLAVSSSSRLPKGEFADAIRSKTVSFDWPLPLWSECLDCGSVTPDKLLTSGPFPAVLTGEMPLKDYYLSWADTFFARDLQPKRGEWNGVGDFLRFFKAVLQRSGGLLPIEQKTGRDAVFPPDRLRYGPLKFGELARATGLTNNVAKSRVEMLEECHVVVRVPALESGSSADISSGGKAYVFNPGLVCLANNWAEPTAEAYEVLWRHVVLWHLRTFVPNVSIRYWERKDRRRRMDFVIQMPNDEIHAVRCCWNWTDVRGDFEAFAGRFPRRRGLNVVVTNDKKHPGILLRNKQFVMLRDLVELESVFEAFPYSAKNVLAPVERYGLLGGSA